MNSIELEQQDLIKKIKIAFNNVTLKDGVGLLETEIIDDYGSDIERKKAREKDEKSDWTKLIDNKYLKSFFGYGGLSFFDDKGITFHIPAYLCTILINPKLDILDSLIYELTNLDQWNIERFRLLNKNQKLVILKFLRHLIKYSKVYGLIEVKDIELAIEKYWKSE